MFGYVIVNKQEMKFKDFEVYQPITADSVRSLRNGTG